MKNLVILIPFLIINFTKPAEIPANWDFDRQLDAYFKAATQQIQDKNRTELENITNWETFTAKSKKELQEMFGLLPFPVKTDLKATITGRIEHDEFYVEKIHFQSIPGLYVTANLYVPRNITKPVPAIVYVCGHATVVENGYNYGAKVRYQHHPAWFARHGYVCIILDTVQLGEIEGVHHGLYQENRWWWLSRGYTPAGVEAWNAIRAIDYLTVRPEVDATKIGITGRSGGGATSWWAAPLDDRIKVVVPVAGITDLYDHVINGCVEGHCDCMYISNKYQWDYPKVAAMVAPRPLLISNSDRDKIFPIEGVFRTYLQVRSIYKNMRAPDQLALHTTAGPHKDVQELRIHAFRWFNQYLQDHDRLISKPAEPFFTPQQLRVFNQLPKDAINHRIDELFVPKAPDLFESLRDVSWPIAKDTWINHLENDIFRNWPDKSMTPSLNKVESFQNPDRKLTIYEMQTDAHTYLPLFKIETPGSTQNEHAKVIIIDDQNWPAWAQKLSTAFPPYSLWEKIDGTKSTSKIPDEELPDVGILYLVTPRGTGVAKFSGDDNKQIQIRRRYYLLGHTMHSLQTWDIFQSIRAINKERKTTGSQLVLWGQGISSGELLYASLYTEEKVSLELIDLPESHMQGPQYLNILKFLDIPATVLLAAEQHDVTIFSGQNSLENTWYPMQTLAAKYPNVSFQAKHF